jgi:hypothetical protein
MYLVDTGEPFVLEANTIPGMTEASLSEAAAAAGSVMLIFARGYCAFQVAKALERAGGARTEGKR